MKIANGFVVSRLFCECLEDEGRLFEDGAGNKRGKKENFHCINSIYCVKKVGYGMRMSHCTMLMSIFCVSVV